MLKLSKSSGTFNAPPYKKVHFDTLGIAIKILKEYFETRIK